eukprot:gene1486-biopygen7791
MNEQINSQTTHPKKELARGDVRHKTMSESGQILDGFLSRPGSGVSGHTFCCSRSIMHCVSVSATKALRLKLCCAAAPQVKARLCGARRRGSWGGGPSGYSHPSPTPDQDTHCGEDQIFPQKALQLTGLFQDLVLPPPLTHPGAPPCHELRAEWSGQDRARAAAAVGATPVSRRGTHETFSCSHCQRKVGCSPAEAWPPFCWRGGARRRASASGWGAEWAELLRQYIRLAPFSEVPPLAKQRDIAATRPVHARGRCAKSKKSSFESEGSAPHQAPPPPQPAVPHPQAGARREQWPQGASAARGAAAWRGGSAFSGFSGAHPGAQIHASRRASAPTRRAARARGGGGCNLSVRMAGTGSRHVDSKEVRVIFCLHFGREFTYKPVFWLFRTFHNLSRVGARYLEIPAFAPRSEPPHARAPGAQMIRIASGSSLAFQRLSRATLKFILSVRLAETRFPGPLLNRSVTESRSVSTRGITMTYS